MNADKPNTLSQRFKKLLQKRKEEIIHLKPYLFLRYLTNLYLAKKITKGDNFKNLQRHYQEIHRQSWVILKYERICDPTTFPSPLNEGEYVSEETFKMQIHALRDNCNIISLSMLLRYLDNSEQPPLGSVVLTFDNGLLDSYFKAAPLLIELEIPATFCISTAYIGTSLTFWDKLIIECVTLFIKNKKTIPPLPSVSETDFGLFASTFDDKGIPTEISIETFITLFLALDSNERMDLITDLEKAIKSQELQFPQWEEFMDWDQIQQLHRAKFEIISKLDTGTPAFFHSPNSLEKEITNSFNTLASYDISIGNIIALPHNSYNIHSLDVLSKHNISYALEGESCPALDVQTKKTKLLRRKSLSEKSTSQKDFFLLDIFT